MIRTTAVVTLVGLLACGAPGHAAPALGYAAVTHERVLDNGLKVVVREDHRAPVVVSMVWYKVGSSYEYGGITGISHMLEHMMFQGTEQHPPGEFSRIVAEQGGRENAFTSRDYTAYFQQFEASRLPISFELEADRMRHLRLLPQELDKERKVVMEERRLRTEDRPQSLAHENFMATAFIASPYHHPVIGWMDDIAHYTLEDLRRWYQTWYAPNNATVVVVGDVQPDTVFALATQYFGPLQPSTIEPPKPRREPERRGDRRVTVKAPAQLPLLLMGYRVPALNTIDEPWKAYALDVLAAVLDGGDSARLPRELVRGRQIAASAGAGYDLYARHDGLLTLEGVPAEGQDMASLEQALREQVRRLREEPVSAPELERIKVQVTAAKVYERDSVFYQANQIGELETLGLGWRVGEAYVEHIRAVTPEQVQAVAKEFLLDDNLTLARLDPLPLEPGQKLPQEEGGISDVQP